MATLENITPHASLRGILPDVLVTVVNVRLFGSEALELTDKTPSGKVANELIYRHDESRLEVVELGRPWSFDGGGELFRLVSEVQRLPGLKFQFAFIHEIRCCAVTPVVMALWIIHATVRGNCESPSCEILKQ